MILGDRLADRSAGGIADAAAFILQEQGENHLNVLVTLFRGRVHHDLRLQDIGQGAEVGVADLRRRELLGHSIHRDVLGGHGGQARQLGRKLLRRSEVGGRRLIGTIHHLVQVLVAVDARLLDGHAGQGNERLDRLGHLGCIGGLSFGRCAKGGGREDRGHQNAQELLHIFSPFLFSVVLYG